jgi:uroporphyrinogen-III synthase
MFCLPKDYHLWVLRSSWSSGIYVARYRDLGYRADCLDLLEIQACPIAFEYSEVVTKKKPSWLVWTSPSCVEILHQNGQKLEYPNVRHYAMGIATQKYLYQRYGVDAFIPKQGTGWDYAFQDIQKMKGLVHILAGDDGRSHSMIKALPDHIQLFSIYKRVYKNIDWDIFWQPSPIALAPGSSEIVRKIFSQASVKDQIALQSIPYVSDHSRIRTLLKSYGVDLVYECLNCPE